MTTDQRPDGVKVVAESRFDEVWCDWCGRGYNKHPECLEVGGIAFGSKACCPRCVESVEKSARKYDEMDFIRARAESAREQSLERPSSTLW